MKYRRSSIALASAAILAVGTQFAGAVPTLYLSDGTNWVQIVDGGTFNNGGYTFGGSVATILQSDLNVNVGAVNFNGTIGLWSVNVATGITDPETVGPFPHLDLNSINNSGVDQNGSLPPNYPSTMTIRWSDTDFGPNIGQSMESKIGGTVNTNQPGSSLTFNVYADAGNTALATTTLLISQTYGPGAFSGDGGGGIMGNFGTPYSVTEEIIITHKGPGNSSFNAEIQVPDGGTTLALLGCSMLGLGTLRRKLGKR